jgi:excisionase family DNA binding protein
VNGIELNFSNFMTVKEAAKLLGVSKGTVRKWTNEGKLEVICHPINSYRLFNEDDLKELLWKLKRKQ